MHLFSLIYLYNLSCLYIIAFFILLGGDFLNQRQKTFCHYYLELGNISQASLKAGYSKSYGNKLLKNPHIRQYIDSQIQNIDDQRIAKATDVIKYLSSVMRGQETEEVIVLENCGSGFSNARNIKKKVSSKERLKAAELLGKRYSIFNHKVDLSQNLPVIIYGEEDILD